MRVVITVEDTPDRPATVVASQPTDQPTPQPAQPSATAPPGEAERTIGAFSGGPAPTPAALHAGLAAPPYEPGSGSAPLPAEYGGDAEDQSAGEAAMPGVLAPPDEGVTAAESSDHEGGPSPAEGMEENDS